MNKIDVGESDPGGGKEMSMISVMTRGACFLAFALASSSFLRGVMTICCSPEVGDSVEELSRMTDPFDDTTMSSVSPNKAMLAIGWVVVDGRENLWTKWEEVVL